MQYETEQRLKATKWQGYDTCSSWASSEDWPCFSFGDYRELFVSWQPSRVKNVLHFPDNLPRSTLTRGGAARWSHLAVLLLPPPACQAVWYNQRTLQRTLGCCQRACEHGKWRLFIIHEEKRSVTNPAGAGKNNEGCQQEPTRGDDVDTEKTKNARLSFCHLQSVLINYWPLIWRQYLNSFCALNKNSCSSVYKVPLTIKLI